MPPDLLFMEAFYEQSQQHSYRGEYGVRTAFNVETWAKLADTRNNMGKKGRGYLVLSPISLKL